MHHAEDYLAKAKAADEAATRALSPVARKCWQTIAETYLEMAAHEVKPDPSKSREKIS